jgi:twitching motility protein PilT
MAYFDPEQLFETMLDAAPGVSDLNLSVGASPQIEVDGKLYRVDFGGLDRLLPYHTELVAMRLLNDKIELADRLIETGSVDLSYALRQRGRFRVNIFSQRGTYSIVLRVISNKIPSFDELGLPPQMSRIADELNGIVLVTGPTGSGKSTSLAAVIDKMNRERAIHIITIEDPIEFLHFHQKAIINQREVGGDTKSFALALRAALRQAPKVILVGEMRDVETISTALEAAETGHLVLSTLHTIDAAKTIDRIVGVFPKNEERQIRTRFAQSFKWIVSQRLVPKKDGGRCAVCEILRATSRTKEYVQEGEREGKSLLDAMEDGGLDGMQTFDSELLRFIEEGTIDATVALSYATNPTNLKIRLGFDGAGNESNDADSDGVVAEPSSEMTVDTDMQNLIER